MYQYIALMTCAKFFAMRHPFIMAALRIADADIILVLFLLSFFYGRPM